MSVPGPERRFAAMQRYSRYRRKTGLNTDGPDPAPLTPSDHRARLGNPVLESGQSVTHHCALRPTARITIGPALLTQSAAPL
jgi:hypothetical protein